MTAVAHEQFVAIAQRRCQVKPVDAAARTAPLLAVAAKNDRWAVELLQDARGNDANHADVPRQVAFDDNKMSGWIELTADLFDEPFCDATFDLLSLAIMRI